MKIKTKIITWNELGPLYREHGTEIVSWQNIRLDPTIPLHREIEVHRMLFQAGGDIIYVGYADGVTYIMPRSEVQKSERYVDATGVVQ